MSIPVYEDILKAEQFIRGYFEPSPFLSSIPFSEKTGRQVYIKWDSRLRTGSFKERGAINFLCHLSEEQRKIGVISASAGNHAMALSFYAKKLGIPCDIVMPKWASLVKITESKKFGAHVMLYGSTFQEAYEYTKELSSKNKKIFVPAFDHKDIISGQGTIGIEVSSQAPEIDSIVVPIGGGGLISGIAIGIKKLRPNVKIIGVQSQWALNSRSGIINSKLAPSTIADGIGVKLIGSLNQKIIDMYVDQIVTVNEDEIAQAIVKLLELERSIVEGAGAVSIAALLNNKSDLFGERTVSIVCGSNIDIDLVHRLLQREMANRGRLWKLKTSVPDRPGTMNFLTNLFAEEGANIIEILHDRSYGEHAGDVEIAFTLEVRDNSHRDEIIKRLESETVRFTQIISQHLVP